MGTFIQGTPVSQGGTEGLNGTVWSRYTGTPTNQIYVSNTDGTNPSTGSLFNEYAINGNFDTDTVWTKGAGWTIAGAGVATAATSDLSEVIPALVQGNTYAITYLLGRSAGSITTSLGGTSSGTPHSSGGFITDIITCGATGGAGGHSLAFSGAAFTGSVDFVIVSDVGAGTGASAAPFKHLADAVNALNNFGSVETHLLLKEGDTFFGETLTTGFTSFGGNGPSSTNPIIITSYHPSAPNVIHPGLAARPIIAAPYGLTPDLAINGGTAKANVGNNIHRIGLDVYSYAQDPANDGTASAPYTNTFIGTKFTGSSVDNGDGTSTLTVSSTQYGTVKLNQLLVSPWGIGSPQITSNLGGGQWLLNGGGVVYSAGTQFIAFDGAGNDINASGGGFSIGLNVNIDNVLYEDCISRFAQNGMSPGSGPASQSTGTKLRRCCMYSSWGQGMFGAGPQNLYIEETVFFKNSHNSQTHSLYLNRPETWTISANNGCAFGPATLDGCILSYDRGGAKIDGGATFNNNLCVHNNVVAVFGASDLTNVGGPATYTNQITNNVVIDQVDSGFGLYGIGAYQGDDFRNNPTDYNDNIFCHSPNAIGSMFPIKLVQGVHDNTVYRNIFYKIPAGIQQFTGSIKDIVITNGGSGYLDGAIFTAFIDDGSGAGSPSGVAGTIMTVTTLISGTICVGQIIVPAPTADWATVISGNGMLVTADLGSSGGGSHKWQLKTPPSFDIDGIHGISASNVASTNYYSQIWWNVTIHGSVSSNGSRNVIVSGGAIASTVPDCGFGFENPQAGDGTGFGSGYVNNETITITPVAGLPSARGFSNGVGSGLAATVTVATNLVGAMTTTDITGTNNFLDLAGTHGSVFQDPDRTIASYAATLGLTASMDAFLAAATTNCKFNWNENYSANAANNYIRAGFGIGGGGGTGDGGGITTITHGQGKHVGRPIKIPHV